MTTDTQLAPTDPEIAALRSEFGITSNGRGIKEFAQVCDFARAVLDKWGQPAHSGEPVAFIHWPINDPPRLVWYSQKALNDAILKTYEGHQPDVKLYTAPQSSPAAQGDALDAARYRWLREQPFDTWKQIAWNTRNNDPGVWVRYDLADGLKEQAIKDRLIALGWTPPPAGAKPSPAAQGDALDAARWKTFTSLPYAIRSEWVCNLSSVPVLTQWVDQARLDVDAARAAQEHNDE